MRTNTKKILGAVAVAGLVAASGSAFTASNSIDNGRAQVGTVKQTVAGINITNVAYTGLDSTWSTSTGVTFDVAEQFDTGVKPTVTINGTALAAEAVTVTPVDAAGAPVEGGATPDHTEVVAAYTATSVSSLDISVSDV